MPSILQIVSLFAFGTFVFYYIEFVDSSFSLWLRNEKPESVSNSQSVSNEEYNNKMERMKVAQNELEESRRELEGVIAKLDILRKKSA